MTKSISGMVPVFINLIVSAIVSITGPFRANAQDHVSMAESGYVDKNTGPVLSEQEVVDRALEYSRTLKTYNTNVQIAEFRYQSSGFIENPELRFRDISTRYIAEDFDEMEVGLRFRFPNLGELDEKKQDARVNIWERKVEEIRYKQELVARMRRNYATVLMYDRQAELAYERVLKENERLDIIESQVELGNRSVVYFTKAKMRYADAKNDYNRAIQRQGLVRRELAKRSGISEHATFVMEDLPEVEQDIDDLIRIAVNKRPEIELVQQRIELADKQNRYERLKRFPWPNFVEVSYHKEEYRHKDWGEVILGIMLPVVDRNQGNIKATDLAARMKKDEYDAVRESIEDEVHSAYTVYKDLLLDWENFREYTEELILNVRTVAEQAKEHKVLMPDDVMEMELTIIDTQKMLSEKRRNLAHALVDLYFAIGIENHEQITVSESVRPGE